MEVHEARRRIIVACSKLAKHGMSPHPIYEPTLNAYLPKDTVFDRAPTFEHIPPDHLERFIEEFENNVQKAITIGEKP